MTHVDLVAGFICGVVFTLSVGWCAIMFYKSEVRSDA